MIRNKFLLALIFHALRLYVAIERPFRAFAKWWKGEGPDVYLEPLTLPEGEVPEVRDATPVFLSETGEAYAPAANGKTLRRVAQNEETGDLVYVSKLPKKERRALKRAKRHDGHHSADASA